MAIDEQFGEAVRAARLQNLDDWKKIVPERQNLLRRKGSSFR
jgi:hypothetical protein